MKHVPDLSTTQDPIAIFSGTYTPNSHRRAPEYLFSAILGYFLHPKLDHGFGSQWLEAFLKYLDLPCEILNPMHLAKAQVEVEKYLSTAAGTIDLMITIPSLKLGENPWRILVENKIWDSSAFNESKGGKAQIERYIEDGLDSVEITNNTWRFVYLIPSLDAITCIDLFQVACKKFPKNLFLATWLNPGKDLRSNSAVTNIQQLLEIKSSKTPSELSSLVLSSVKHWLPVIEAPNQPIEKNRFPRTRDIKEHSILGEKFEPWFEFFKQSKHKNCLPKSDKTSIGIRDESSRDQHNNKDNWLYRLRTTSGYYTEASEKQKYLDLLQSIQIELRLKSYESLSKAPDWGKWLAETGASIFQNQIHFGGPNNSSGCVVININNPLTVEQVGRFDALLRNYRPPPLLKKSNQQIGNAGLYWVCYQLTLLGWNVLPTSRNARGVDVVIYSEDGSQTRTVQVKTLSNRSPVPLGTHLDNLIADVIVIVINVARNPEIYILSPGEVRDGVHKGVKDGKVSYWLQPSAYELSVFRDRWDKVGGDEQRH